jgi:predicted unusual protein kinase regulating ubiquinone biosynthesis (AarF/ABC1/UbiB family)
MSFVRGRHLEQFLKQKPNQKLRDQLGTNLVELFYFQLLKLGAFHADPHWGNYLFNDNASIGLVDFGCAKKLAPAELKYLKSVFLYPGDRHSPEFRRVLETNYRAQGKKTLDAGLSRVSQFLGEVLPKRLSTRTRTTRAF